MHTCVASVSSAIPEWAVPLCLAGVDRGASVRGNDEASEAPICTCVEWVARTAVTSCDQEAPCLADCR